MLHKTDNTTEKINNFAYIPNISEIVLSLLPSEKDFNDKEETSDGNPVVMYHNSGIYEKSLQMHSLLMDIFNFMSLFATWVLETHRAFSTGKSRGLNV